MDDVDEMDGTGIEARGNKVLILRGSEQAILEGENQIASFPQDLEISGSLAKVVDMGSKVEIDLERGDLAIVDRNRGLPLKTDLNFDMTTKELRLIDEYHIYGVFGLSKDLVLPGTGEED